MIRNILVWILTIIPLVIVPFAPAQQTVKVPRVGILHAGFASTTAPFIEAFRHRLRELGYVEGQNLILEYRFAEDRFERLPGLANELVGLPVDVMLPAGNQAISAARQATKTIPIVMATSGDPVRQGFVESLARPGANVTGLTMQSPDLSGKRLELLLEVAPKLSAVAVLLKSGNPLHTFVRQETEDAAQALKIKLQSVEIREPDELENALVKMAKNRASALVVPLEPMFHNHAGRIVNLAAKHRLAAIYGDRLYVDAGGLMSYGANIVDNFRRAATYVDKILKGAKPTDLPVERPIKFDLIISLKAAKQIGLTIPPNVLARADRLIR